MSNTAWPAPASWSAPVWQWGGHLQTIGPALMGRHQLPRPPYRRQRWTTPDQDFIEVDWLDAGPSASGYNQRPLLVLFHGLEGSSSSHYAKAFAHVAHQLGWDFAVPHFRGCSGPMNIAARAYHSGDYEEIDWMLSRIADEHARPDSPVVAVGVSLGGNALLRWAQQTGYRAQNRVRALTAISAPLDLAAGALAIDQGLNRHLYARMFLSSMVPRALHRLSLHPGLFDGQALRQVRTLQAFDDIFTAPVHGFKNALHYYECCSSKPHLAALKVPSLVLNALNDPFIPASCLPPLNQNRDDDQGLVTLWQPSEGGHVGFANRREPQNACALAQVVCQWLQQGL